MVNKNSHSAYNPSSISPSSNIVFHEEIEKLKISVKRLKEIQILLLQGIEAYQNSSISRVVEFDDIRHKAKKILREDIE